MNVTQTDVQAPATNVNIFAPKVNTNEVEQASNFGEFPYPEARTRLINYGYYENLFMGNHFDAFNMRVDNAQYGREYAKLRYVKANFAGLISKVIADFLFSEPITIKVPDGDQDFIDSLVRANKLDTQFYESALSNSYFGDALFKIRSGPRRQYDKTSSCIIEDVTPSIYFPKVDGFNVKADPAEVELAWTFKLNNKMYLRKEIHRSGVLLNEVWQIEGTKIVQKVDINILGLNLSEAVLTGIPEPLIYHVANWKTGNRYFGISDYHDLDALFYAINNRLTKTDNILDKHGDPILAVPQGILDEQGKIQKKAMGVIELKEGENSKPEYIVWDANLDSAFKQVEKMVEILLMTSEVSPDAFGMGTGQSDSGRALKYKLLRIIAKAARKKLYYDTAIKEMLYTAQVFAKKWGLEAEPGVKLKMEPAKVELEWKDGIPVDESELLDNETKAIDIGITSKKDSIMRVYGLDEQSAEEKLEEIEKEQPKIEMPLMKLGMNEKAVDPKTGMPPKNGMMNKK